MISARKNSLRVVSDAQKIWPLLNGVFCVYKPSNLTINQTRLTLISNICRGKEKTFNYFKLLIEDLMIFRFK